MFLVKTRLEWDLFTRPKIVLKGFVVTIRHTIRGFPNISITNIKCLRYQDLRANSQARKKDTSSIVPN